MNNQLKTTIRKALILSFLSGAIVSTLPTKTIAETPTPETFSQECAAADWPNLKAQIETRYNDVQISLNQILDEVKNTTIPPDQVNSEKQIESIDSLLSCLNSPQLPVTLSPQKDKAVQLLTNFKNNILNRARNGLVNNDDDVFNGQDNFYSLKRNLQLEESVAQIPTIGPDFITAFEGAIETFTNDVSSQISQLSETLPPSPPPSSDPAQTSNNTTEQNNSPSSGKSQANSLRLLAAILLLIAIPVIVFKVRSDRSNHSHRRSRRSSKLLSTLQTEYHLPLLSSKGKWKPEAAQDLPGEEMDERSEIGYLKQKIDNLERQMEKTNRSIASIEQRLNELNSLNLSQQSSNIVSKSSSVPYQSNPSPTFSVHNDTYQQDSQVSATPRTLSELIQLYNVTPGKLQGIGVSETAESFNQRRSGLNVAAVLHQASNPSFYIVQNLYLVPRPGSKVTTHKLNTIDALFDCQNFSSGAPFQLIEPAIVSPLGNNQWQLSQRGKLKFL
jgi:hypothetical protein